MHWLKNLKLTPKLMLAFGVVLALMLVQGVGAYLGLSSLNRATTHLAGNTMDTVSTAAELRALLGEYRISSYRGLTRASEAVKQDARKQSADLAARIEATSADFAKLATTPEERKLQEQFAAAPQPKFRFHPHFSRAGGQFPSHAGLRFGCVDAEVDEVAGAGAQIDEHPAGADPGQDSSLGQIFCLHHGCWPPDVTESFAVQRPVMVVRRSQRSDRSVLPEPVQPERRAVDRAGGIEAD